MAVLKLSEQRYTEEEYLALLADSDHRMEYHDGYVIEMFGAKANHNRIKEDTAGHLFAQLDDCRPLGSDMAVYVEELGNYYFPDMVYVCGEEDRFKDDDQLNLLNPSVLIEVLSKSTESFDRGGKFHAYWRIPTLQEYILIDSLSMRVDIFRRNGQKEWTMLSFTQLGDVIPFEALGAKILIDKIYQRVKFEVEE